MGAAIKGKKKAKDLPLPKNTSGPPTHLAPDQPEDTQASKISALTDALIYEDKILPVHKKRTSTSSESSRSSSLDPPRSAFIYRGRQATSRQEFIRNIEIFRNKFKAEEEPTTIFPGWTDDLIQNLVPNMPFRVLFIFQFISKRWHQFCEPFIQKQLRQITFLVGPKFTTDKPRRPQPTGVLPFLPVRRTQFFSCLSRPT